MTAGCGSKPKAPVSSTKAGPPKARLAYVRIDDLVDRHPLQQDVRRLKAAERRLGALAGGLPVTDMADSASPAGYELSPLDSVTLGRAGTSAGASAARQKRRASARDEFSAEVSGALTRYSAERDRRHTLLTDQRRSEMLAVGLRDDAASERKARDDEDVKVRAGIEGFMGRVLLLQTRIAILNGQLDTPPLDVFVAAQPSDAEYEKQAAELDNYEAQKQAESLKPVAERLAIEPPSGITMLVRLKVARVAQLARLKALQGELDKIKAQGNGASDDAVGRIQRERLAEIDRELAALSDEVALQALIGRENKAMREVLDSEDRVAKKFAAGDGSTEAASGMPGTASLPILFGSHLARLDRADIERAIKRIQAQQARLERYIRLDIVTAIGDSARERNIDVVTVYRGVKPPGITAGRTDMTAQFETWIVQPGQDAVKKPAERSVKSAERRAGG